MTNFSSFVQSDLEKSFSDQTDTISTLIDREVLLTGGTGFIGTWIVAAFDYLYKNFGGSGSLTVLSRNGSDEVSSFMAENKRIHQVLGDVRELKRGQFSEHDFVIHSATPSISHSLDQWERELSSIIIDGQEALLKSLGTNRPRFVFLSSGSVYGETKGLTQPLNENAFFGVDPLRSNAYRESKRLAELRLKMAHDYGEISLIVQRLFAFHGPLLPWNAHFAVGNFLRDVASGKKIVVDSDGLSTRSYLYASDMAAWILCIAEEGEIGNSYNVGSEVPISINQLATHIDYLFRGVGVEIKGRLRKKEEIDFYVPDVSRAKGLGMREKITIAEGLKRSFDWGVSFS